MARPPLAPCLALATFLGACGAFSSDRIPEIAWGPETTREAELLFEHQGCVACHAVPVRSESRVPRAAAPDLRQVGARVTPQYLRALLADPQAAKPGTPMPDLLAGLSRRARAEAEEALVHFLVSRGGAIDQGPVTADPGAIERGRILFHEVGCAACHAPREEAWELEYFHWTLESDDPPEPPTVDGGVERAPPAPWTVTPLGDLRRKTTVAALAEFLLDPVSARPSGRMPSLDLERDEALDIARYLLRDPEADPVQPTPGLFCEEFSGNFGGGNPDLDAMECSARSVVAAPSELVPTRDDHFGYRMRGFVQVEKAGIHTFFTTSDDGSRLWIDGELLVDNWGDHGAREASGERWLDTGPHAIAITWYEAGGDEVLEVEWQGPEFEREVLPAERLTHRAVTLRPVGAEAFELDARLAARGEQLFDELGCARCHEPERADGEAARPFAELDGRGRRGCLSSRPGKRAPRYTLDGRQRGLLQALVARGDDAWAPLEPTEHIARTLEHLSCLACHERDGRGGPALERMPYFLTRGEADLGDEGRIPPTLDGVGGKLRPEWLAEVLFEKGRARPYMLTRMPSFDSLDLAGLDELFTATDPPPRGDREPPFTEDSIADGQRLAGTKGLGCIQCHTFGGHDSLGIPATDLANVYERIRPGWFQELLMDPVALGMNSRMPQFWSDTGSPAKDVLGGDPEAQVDALWTYLALGDAAPLPEGLIVREEEFELVPLDEPVLCGVFMQGLSPRVTLVGHPERTHVAFDVQNSRLAKAWRGRFFNARGTWHERAGQLEKPPSDDVLDLPLGAPFARLESPDAPWPLEPGRAAGYRVLGLRYDESRRPVFRYALGDVAVDEVAIPLLRPGASWVRRRFELRGDGAGGELFFRAASGRSIQQDEDRTWVVDGRMRLALPQTARLRPSPTSEDRVELLVPLELAGTEATVLEVEFTW